MSQIPATDTAWENVIQYAQQPNTTIRTADRGSENEIGVDSNQQIFFRKPHGNKRPVQYSEFIEIWETFESTGQIMREQVGEMTSSWAGAALFGALNEIFNFELDTSASPIRLVSTD